MLAATRATVAATDTTTKTGTETADGAEAASSDAASATAHLAVALVTSTTAGSLTAAHPMSVASRGAFSVGRTSPCV